MTKKKLTKFEKEFTALRKKIDAADRALLSTMAKRFEIVKKIGFVKQKMGAPIYQKSRWQALARDRVRHARKLGINKDFAHALYQLIHKEALRIQRKHRK